MTNDSRLTIELVNALGFRGDVESTEILSEELAPSDGELGGVSWREPWRRLHHRGPSKP